MNVLSNQTKSNRRKATEIILFGDVATNKSVIKMVKNTQQQTFLLVQLENEVLEKTMNFKEIYDFLNMYDYKIIMLAIATIIKNNMEYAIIEKDGEEQAISASLLEQIEENSEGYTLTVQKENKYLLKLKGLFEKRNYNGNIFLNIVENMHNWFYSLPKYCLITEKQYIGNGKYKNIEKCLIGFKNSLRGIVKNPYFYITFTLPEIFESNVYNKIKNAKIFIDETITNLKITLKSDIDAIFPENLNEWYQSLSDFSINKIYKNGEEKFLKFCRDNEKFDINELCKYLTGLSVENWNEETPTIFYKELIKIRSTIESEHNTEIKEGFIIKYIDKNGSEIEKTLDVSQIEANDSSNLLNADIKAILKDYGTSLSHLSKIGAVLKLTFEEVI